MHSVEHIQHCRTKKPLQLEGSVAMVGNSDALLDKEYGAEIDAHDSVFRFNLAELAPQFEASIGKKADYYFLSQNITTLRFPHPEPLQSRFRDICRSSKIICYPNHTKNVMKYCKRPYVIASDVAMINQGIKHLFGRPPVEFPPNNHPRNGIKLLVALLMAGIKPTLYGFDLGPRQDAKHYFDDEVQVDVGAGNPGHRPSLEFALLSASVARGMISVKN